MYRNEKNINDQTVSIRSSLLQLFSPYPLLTRLYSGTPTSRWVVPSLSSTFPSSVFKCPPAYLTGAYWPFLASRNSDNNFDDNFCLWLTMTVLLATTICECLPMTKNGVNRCWRVMGKSRPLEEHDRSKRWPTIADPTMPNGSRPDHVKSQADHANQ